MTAVRSYDGSGNNLVHAAWSLADYNTTRAAYGLPKVTSFAQITSDAAMQAKLQQLYGTVDKIDLWVGVPAEDHTPGSSVGATDRAILVDQFSRLRARGDFHFGVAEGDLRLAEVGRPLEQRPLRFGAGDLGPGGGVPVPALQLLAVVVREQHPLDVLDAECREFAYGRTVTEVDEDRGVAVADDVGVAGVGDAEHVGGDFGGRHGDAPGEHDEGASRPAVPASPVCGGIEGPRRGGPPSRAGRFRPPPVCGGIEGGCRDPTPALPPSGEGGQ